MPDKQGKLSPEEKEKVQAWLKDKWKASASCPISGDSKWIVGDYITTPLNFGKGGLIVGGRVQPQITLVCATCGYTLFFNAMVMGGLLSPTEKTNGEK